MVSWYLVLLGLLALQRLGEVALTRRHTTWARARGAVERGRGHFFAMKLLHAAFLLGCAAEVVFLGRVFSPAVGWAMLVLVAAAQGTRYWTMRALGPYWNARVLVVPGDPVVCDGPYRWLRHPNYAAVICEGVAVPMVHGAWLTACVFSALNALLLAARVRCEESTLRALTDYEECFATLPRFLPRLWSGRAHRVAGVEMAPHAGT